MISFLPMKRSGLFLLSLIFGSIGQAIGQVVVDNSFSSGQALVGPNFQIPGSLGKTVGGNLFHSFTEFNVQTGGSATFTGPNAINNILGRPIVVIHHRRHEAYRDEAAAEGQGGLEGLLAARHGCAL